MAVTWSCVNISLEEQRRRQERKAEGGEGGVAEFREEFHSVLATYQSALKLTNLTQRQSALLKLSEKFSTESESSPLWSGYEGKLGVEEQFQVKQLLSCIYRNLATLYEQQEETQLKSEETPLKVEEKKLLEEEETREKGEETPQEKVEKDQEIETIDLNSDEETKEIHEKSIEENKESTQQKSNDENQEPNLKPKMEDNEPNSNPKMEDNEPNSNPKMEDNEPNPMSLTETPSKLPNSIRYYIKSLTIQGTDLQIWLKLGSLCHRRQYLHHARWSLERVTQLGVEGYRSPWKWQGLTRLIEVLYDIGDTRACLHWVDQALQVVPDFPRGQWLRTHLTHQLNGTHTSIPSNLITSPHLSRKRQFEPLTSTRPKRTLVTTPIILKDRDWVSLGSELLAAYKEDLKDFKTSSSSLSSVPQRILHVTFEAPAEMEGTMPEDRDASGSGTPKPPSTKKRSLPPPSTRPARTRAGAARDDPDPSHGATTKNMTAFYEAITELFQFKGYQPPEDHPTPLTFLAASSQGLESAIKDFALKLRNKLATEYKPIYSSSWARDYLSIRKSYASAKRGAASGILSPPIDTIDLTTGLDSFITELNTAKMVAADWLLEFLLRLFGDPVGPPGTVCPWLQGRWPPSLLRVTMQILVTLLPSLVPGFPFASLPLRTRFAWLIGICELVMVSKKWEAGISTKTSSYAITTLASPASVQCWLTHLETERHYWKDPMDPDLALRYWWLVASSHSQSDPQRELVALKQVADLLTRNKTTNVDEDYEVNHPNCTYGTRISLELVEERRVKAEILREKAQSTSDTEYSPHYLLPHIRVLTHRLDTGNSKESSHLTLATHILKYSTRPCFTDDQAEVTASDRSYVHHCKLRAAMIVLEIRLCDLFSSIVEFCHLKESSVFKSTSSTLGTGVHVKPSPELYLAQIRDNFEAIALVVQGISPHLHAPVDSEMSLSRILTPAQLTTYYHLSQVVIHLIGALLKLSDTFLTHPQSMDVCQVFMVRGLEFFLQCTLKLPPLIEVTTEKEEEEEETLDNSISEFIFLIHNEFGKFKLCEVESGSLPRCLMTVLKQLSDTNCQEDINQCLTCLYLLPINKQPLYKEEHARHAQPLDITAATEIYHAVWEIVEPKMIKGTTVQPSYKNILDTLGQFLLQDTITQSAVYSFNRKLIDGYLDQEMDFFKRVKDIEGSPLATIGEMGNVNIKLPKLYATLFLTLGHIQINQIQTKLHQTWTVVEADIEAMMDSFKRHLYLCPHSVEGWYFLGLSYDIYAAGLLCRSQTKSTEEYGSISTLQKKGLFCYAEAARWLHQAPSYSLSCSITLDTFWSAFGTLVYTSASKPMAMDVYEFEPHQGMKLVPEATLRSGYAACPVKLPRPGMIYRFALSLFHRSLKVQPYRWEPCMMVAKCFGKLKIFPKEAILFLQQAVKYSSKEFTQDPLIEPSYQLISFLYKYRTKKLMSDDEIGTALAYCQFDKVSKESVAREDPPSPTDTKTVAPGEEESSALPLLLQALTHLKSLDKEWRHRLSYRMAWIQFHEYGDVKGALDEMENLVNIKKTIANFVNVWKPMLERPGKHFVYVAQYITFMYKLMVDFTPLFLATFLKRVQKINFRIYRYHQVWSQGITLYVEVSRSHYKIPHHHLLGHPWSSDGFHIATQSTRRQICHFLHPPSDTIFDVEEELRRPLYLELKLAFELAKLPTTPPTPLPPLDLVTYLGDLYFSLLLSFQFDPTTTLPPRPDHTPLRAFHPPDLWRCLELFMRESIASTSTPSSQSKPPTTTLPTTTHSASSQSKPTTTTTTTLPPKLPETT